MADSELRNRKPAAASSEQERAPSSEQQKASESGTGTLLTIAGLFTAFMAILALLTISASTPLSQADSPWLASVQNAVKTYLPFLPFGESTSSPSTFLLTDVELAKYDGKDPDLPILIAINATIFDVSSGRSFYGPGGHYNHFAGRDATRAWVTTCFEPEHLTWDLKGVEEMFAPRWLDEEIEVAARGEVKPGMGGMNEMLKEQAAKALERAGGGVGKKEKATRRVEDQEVVKKGIEDALGHWLNFFKGSEKYKEVGRVVKRDPLDEDRKDIPLCEGALKKRPVRGGKLGKALEAVFQNQKAAGGPPFR
ncbi:cytochrome b5 [Aulographum hederae CBS 113979]|uniref:Cytochrome b5 n=1 Tax=Aulographum hederae CBS 113979 TaxID=1176131 RepID=A0A6G1GW04_9PEZI|nr:cytochrome b5 [Aulographum hederae CBS 113979]